MLVLSRKVGEEIVLPSQAVTIGVVAVRGGQVRLGIAAPSDISVHRGEVWRRVCESREIADGRGIRPERATTNDSKMAWQHEIRRKITARTYGHVLGIEVEVVDGRLIVHGRSHSYYGKQLACAAALEVIETLDLGCAKQVELDIAVLGTR